MNPNHLLRPDGRWLQPKQLLLIPARVAIAMQEDGWTCRNDIIWYKPNGLPSSVKDRLANKYEHVFHFVKSRRYYYDLDSIRVPQQTLAPAAGRGRSRNHQVYNPYDGQTGTALGQNGPGGLVGGARAQGRIGALRLLRVDGKNPGDVIAGRNKTADLPKLGSMRNPPEPDETGAFHPLGKNPGDLLELGDESLGFEETPTDARELAYWTGVVLEEYARVVNGGPRRFSGKHELLSPDAAHFRIILNSGQSRNAVYSIVENLRVSPRLKQQLRNWWHDHSSHWRGPNPGDFWKISTRPFPEAHFAVYPEELCIRPILSSCPPSVCKACGRAPLPVSSKRAFRREQDWRSISKARNMPVRETPSHGAGGHTGFFVGRSGTGHANRKTCDCGAGFEPSIVFDPFAGAGTTLLVVKKLGRRWFGCELNPKFVKMARRRLAMVN